MYDIGYARWGGPYPGSFEPIGRVQYYSVSPGRLAGPVWEKTDVQAARLFVGFHVGGKPRYEIDDLIPIVREMRRRQAPHDPSATFIAQRGIYRYRGTGKIIEEKGAQVMIFDFMDTAPETFREQMIRLAEEIAKRLRQELVIVEIQRNGVVTSTIGVSA